MEADAATFPRRWGLSQQAAVCVVFVLAMFMTVMDITIVNVALPAMGRNLHIAGTGISAVSIAYVISIAVFIPLSGWLGDRFGHRNVLLCAIVVFTLASVLCGLSQNLGEIVVARVIQGIGGGLMTPVGMALLFRTFPPAERVRVISVLMIPTILAPITGPVLGGLLVDDLSWRWVFFVNLPLGVVAVTFGLIFLRPEPGEPTGPFDFVGFALAGLGLASLTYGLSEGPTQGWGSAEIVATFLVGVVLLILLVYQQLHTEHPLLSLRVFRDRLFRSGTTVTVFASMAFFGFLFILALFLQNGLGFSPLKSGLSTIPEAIGVLLGSQLISRVLYPRMGPKPLLVAGSFAEAGVLLLLTTIDSSSQLWLMRLYVFAVGFSMSFVLVTAQVATMARIDRAATGAASTLYNVARQVATAFGVAVVATALALVGEPAAIPGRPVNDLSSYHVAFAVAAGLALLCGFAALTIRNADADSTRTHLAKKSNEEITTGEGLTPGLEAVDGEPETTGPPHASPASQLLTQE
jgi:EmrB/QacA subfamily drug resistance transporter